MATYLDPLVAASRRRVAELLARQPVEAVVAMATEVPPPASFVDALTAPGVSVIAEVKRASPSRGTLAPGADAVMVASAYRDGGAAAISVLTEPDRFLGSLDDLTAVSGLGVPTLRKDFLVHPVQVWEARAAGAAAVLLIAAVLDDRTIDALVAAADEAGLDVLHEVHDATELARLERLAPRIVGVNARDLRDFRVHPDRFAELAAHRPSGALLVAESGILGPEDVVRVGSLGADAVLVGEALVTAMDRVAATRAMVDAGRTEVRAWT